MSLLHEDHDAQPDPTPRSGSELMIEALNPFDVPGYPRESLELGSQRTNRFTGLSNTGPIYRFGVRMSFD